MKLNKISFIALCTAAIFASPSLTFAQRDNGGAGEFGGKVTAVDATAKTITITPSARVGGDARTFTVTDATKIEVDGKAGTLADIKVDMKAKVTPGTEPTSAAAISAKVGKRGGNDGAGGRGNESVAPGASGAR